MKQQCFQEADPILFQLSTAFLCPEFKEVMSHPCKLALCLDEYLKLSWKQSWLVLNESTQELCDGLHDCEWLFQEWHLVQYGACLSVVMGPPLDAFQGSCSNLLKLLSSSAVASLSLRFSCWFESWRCRSLNLVDGFVLPFCFFDCDLSNVCIILSFRLMN